MPSRPATAAGLSIGLSMGIGGVASVGIGALADATGLEAALLSCVVVAVVAAGRLGVPAHRRAGESAHRDATPSAATACRREPRMCGVSAADAAWNLLRSGAGHHDEAAEIALGLVRRPDDRAPTTWRRPARCCSPCTATPTPWPPATARSRAARRPCCWRTSTPPAASSSTATTARRRAALSRPPGRRAGPAAPRHARHGLRPRRADAGLAHRRPRGLGVRERVSSPRGRPSAGRRARATACAPRCCSAAGSGARPAESAAALDWPAAAWFDALVLEPVPTSVVERVLIERDVAIPLRDGTVLRADVWRPAGDGRYPTILQRLPYDKANSFITAHLYGLEPLRAVAAGFNLVLQDCRGTVHVGRRLRAVRRRGAGRRRHDRLDRRPALQRRRGGDVRRVVRRRDAAPGRDGEPAGAPRDRAAPDRVRVPRGLDLPGRRVPAGLRAELVARRARRRVAGEARRGGRGRRAARGRVRRRERCDRPVLRAAAADRPAARRPLVPAYRDWLSRPERDAMWQATAISERYGSIDVPALHIGGWSDIFLEGTIRNYVGLRAGAATEAAREGQRLVIGPWAHGNPHEVVGELDHGPAASQLAVDMTSLHLAFFESVLRGESPPGAAGAHLHDGRQRVAGRGRVADRPHARAAPVPARRRPGQRRGGRRRPLGGEPGRRAAGPLRLRPARPGADRRRLHAPAVAAHRRPLRPARPAGDRGARRRARLHERAAAAGHRGHRRGAPDAGRRELGAGHRLDGEARRRRTPTGGRSASPTASCAPATARASTGPRCWSPSVRRASRSCSARPACCSAPGIASGCRSRARTSRASRRHPNVGGDLAAATEADLRPRAPDGLPRRRARVVPRAADRPAATRLTRHATFHAVYD